jgi:GNAT superfamily N-acetyltransferase
MSRGGTVATGQNPSVPIRPASDADLDELVRLRLAFVADVRGVEPGSFDQECADVTRAFFVDTMARGTIRSWIADDDGTAIGIVSLLIEDSPPLPERPLVREGYVINLWVDPAHRRKGMARLLLDETVAIAPSLRLRGLRLRWTDEGRPLYEHAGFTDDEKVMVLRTDGS